MKDICEYNGKVYTRKNLKVKSSKAESLELSNVFIRAKKMIDPDYSREDDFDED